MLSSINRIKKERDFAAIFKNSKIFKTNILIFRIAKNDLGINRAGVVVSLKVSKKATVRNKVRRRLSEAVRPELERIKKGTDVVIIALPGIDKKEFFEIKEAIHNTCLKL